jgi:hypothetical protein
MLSIPRITTNLSVTLNVVREVREYTHTHACTCAHFLERKFMQLKYLMLEQSIFAPVGMQYVVLTMIIMPF